jgi:hypothetical protein
MSRKDLPEPDERAHDGDIDLDRALTPQHAGEHRHSLLGEGVGERAWISMFLGTGHNL